MDERNHFVENCAPLTTPINYYISSSVICPLLLANFIHVWTNAIFAMRAFEEESGTEEFDSDTEGT
jgi:hypothetical protein